MKQSMVLVAVLLAVAAIASCKGNGGAENTPGKAVENPTTAPNPEPGGGACDGDEGTCLKAIGEAAEAKDDTTVANLAAAGCARNLAGACALLALAQVNGQGTPVSLTEAEANFGKACDLGSLKACVKLAANMDGEVFRADPPRRLAILGKACKGGEIDGCFLGGATLIQSDEPKDVEAGYDILKRTCDQGHEGACKVAATMDAEMEKLRRAAEADAGPNVEWTVAPAIDHLVEFVKVKGCQGNARLQRCSVVLNVKGKLERNVRSSVLDVDGVRLDQGIVLSPRYTTPGVAEAVDINLQSGAAKVVFDY